jgi:hypothetical protein
MRAGCTCCHQRCTTGQRAAAIDVETLQILALPLIRAATYPDLIF